MKHILNYIHNEERVKYAVETALMIIISASLIALSIIIAAFYGS